VTVARSPGFSFAYRITNTTGHDLTYGVGSGTLNMHMEIKVRMEPDFIDMDTYGKAWNEEYRYATLKAGETFKQTMNLMPGAINTESDAYWNGYWADLSAQEIDWYPPGEYRGTAVFSWIPGTPEGFEGNSERLELEFPIMLIDGSSGELASSNPPLPAISGADTGVLTAIETTATEAPMKNDPANPVILTPAQAIYPVGTEEITVTWYNGAEEDLIFGYPFILQIRKGGGWIDAEPIEKLMFLLPGFLLKPGESKENTYDIGHYYGPLDKGRYRIAANYFYDKDRPIRSDVQRHEVYAKFEVK